MYIFSAMKLIFSYYIMDSRFVDVELLILMVKERPAIWDKALNAYKDKNETRAAWREICAQLKDGFENLGEKQKDEYAKKITSKWYNVRDNWLRAFKRTKEEINGTVGKIKRKYVFYDKLMFLEKVYDQQDASDVETTKQLSTSDDSLSEPLLVPKDEYDTHKKRSERKRRVSDFVAKSSNPLNSSQLSDEKRGKSENIRNNSYNIPENMTDPHMLFFVSILPLVSQFKEDDTLEFRMGVLKLIKTIREQSEDVCNSNTRT